MGHVSSFLPPWVPDLPGTIGTVPCPLRVPAHASLSYTEASVTQEWSGSRLSYAHSQLKCSRPLLLYLLHFYLELLPSWNYKAHAQLRWEMPDHF